MTDRSTRLWIQIICLFLLSWSVATGCQSKDTTPKNADKPTTPPPTRPEESASADTTITPPSVSEPDASSTAPTSVPLDEVGKKAGAFKTNDGQFALVFQTGMHIEKLKAMLDQAETLNKARVTDKKTQVQEVVGKKVIVQTWTVQLPGGPIKEVQLSLFGTLLVGVTTLHKDKDDERIARYTATYGEASVTERWMGWWDPVNEQVIQASVDTLRYEVFDLRAARVVAPKIHQLMGQAWVRRYGKPPAWFK